MRPVHVTADGRGEIHRDPQGAGQRGKHGQQIQPSRGPEGPAGELQVEVGNPLQVLQEHDRPHHARGRGRDQIGQVAAEVHPRNDHVEHEEGEERVSREVGEVQQQRQGHQVEEDLQEDVPLDALRGDCPVAAAELEDQVVRQHHASDGIQRERLREHAQQPGGGGDQEDADARPKAERDQPAGAFRWEFHRDSASVLVLSS